MLIYQCSIMANTRNRIMVSSNVPIHSELHSLHFRVMTSNDVLQLSVQKIYTHFTFDTLDHPYSGGLYDTALGPFSEKSGLCGTCFKNIYQCPGHLGHIELPLSVINPLFLNVIMQLMKVICLSCYTLQFPENMKSMISLVLDLLDSGFICEAQELFQQMGIMDDEQKTNLEDDLEDNLLNERYGKYLGLVLNNSGHCGDNEDNFLNKNIESLKIFFVSTIFKLYSKVRKVCINCKEKQAKIKMHQGKIMIIEPDKKREQDDTLCTNEPKILMPDQLKDIMRSLWENEKNVLRKIYHILTTVEIDYPTDIFFLDVIPVTPSSVRPINFVESKMVEHPQTTLYKNILQNCNFLNTIIHVEQNENIKNVSENMRALYDELEGTNAAEKINIVWQDLQYSINNLMTSEAKQEYNAVGQGIKEVIEKKHGIIRKHMMGKRVNFAARSVITPDPNLNIDEIGIPEEFAKRLTYPVPVTSWNVREMEKLILNGPLIHPGAVMIEFEDGSVKNIPNNIKVQEVIAKKLLLSEESKENFNGLKIVHRHLLNGDPLIMNRQPTLHKPSIMAHKAKVLKGEKTLRLHYANCKAYNADFDGDEMNAHFPQNELARSEAHSIANVSNQYLVPKDGTPLSGLIQDNVISGVSLSLRGRFFSKLDYQSLVYFALGHKTGHIQTLQPAVLKPVPLWSGKQIISTVIINNLPKSSSLINLNTKAKIGAKVWENSKKHTWHAGGAPFTKEHTMCESEVIIRNGELLCGVLDKTQYGATPYGLVHCVYELYGGSYSINLLSSFSKLFTFFLQREGFTLGVQDILVTAEANKKRKEFITESRKVGPALLASIVNISSDNSEDLVTSKIEEMCAINSKFKTIIDRRYKTTMDSFSNDINKICVPSGLLKQFPENNLQLMIQSGAKGSAVNAMQISSLLGQIELEGKRPPCMLSGRSLPSFRPFDSSPRAGGFIDGRFMSGIRPQEFFFHCMAGREGLIDTAVKTSRSGYLQRCLVKHLEGLNVAYDLTVRDSDNSVIQFLYGEDGMDVSKVQFMNSKHISFLVDNIDAIITKDFNKYFEESNKKLEKHRKSIRKWIKKYGNPILNKSNKYTEEYFGRKMCPDPVISKFQPDSHLGVLNERLQLLMNDCLHNRENPEKFIKMMEFKTSSSMCFPGEPVGLLAAQSIGEPSTQMTLNTFHFAGRGDMNVTLGIPRLKEMLMTASKYIKTPSMVVPFLENLNNLETVADHLRKRLTRVTVNQVLEKVNIKIKLDFKVGREQIYTVRFHFLPYKYYKADFNVKPKTILKYMEKHFFIDLFQLLKKQSEAKTSVIIIENSKKNKNAYENAEDEENEFESDEKKKKTESNSKTYIDESDVESVIDNEEAANNISDDESDNENNNEKDASDIDLNEQLTKENTNTEEQNNSLLSEEKDVLNKLKFALNYTYDKEKSQWCELVFSLPLVFKQIDISALIKEVASKSVIWEVPNIKRAITYRNSKGELMLRTDGLNFNEMFKYRRILDLNRLYSNDIHGVASTYGIEAAIQVMVKEMKDVFSVYGIVVDPRHLLLVADYMMYNGTYQPLSRKGIESGVSPLQQMSFEGSLSFLKSALIGGKTDKLKSPSSCLVTGRPCKGGTGAFSLFHNFQHVS